MRVYPKRGPKAIVELTSAEYARLQLEIYHESAANILYLVDITNKLACFSETGTLEH